MAVLLDRHQRPLRNLRLSVTDRCNLRCSYCMPETDYVWLPREDILHFEEMEALVERTAMSPFIREKKDYFTAFFDARARLVASSNLPRLKHSTASMRRAPNRASYAERSQPTCCRSPCSAAISLVRAILPQETWSSGVA